ncbi:alpha/beta hydrolase family protein [Undibacterium curvum]|uniref:S9 family peptidase n=1 Tax=Undibacterium curvum TaxID=2762294 RepID=A0ABR7A484_9BURK|nr:S9 family peptidase [Undibacterium curvum]MBC3931714.1 S9 family peptidase [Undibacterium curvum]
MKLYRLLIAALLSFNFCSATQAIEKISLENFIKFDKFSQPRISPDGKHIALILNVQNEERLVPVMSVFELPGFKLKSMVRMSAFEVPGNFVWLNNQRILVEKADERGSQEGPEWTGEILAFDLDGGKQEYLYGYRMFKQSSKGNKYQNDYSFGYIEYIPNNSDGKFYVGAQYWDREYTSLYEINANNASRKLIADIPQSGLRFTFNNDGIPVFAHGTDKDFKPVLFQKVQNQWIKITDIELGLRFSPLMFTLDNSEFFALFSQNGEPAKIVRQNLLTKQRKVVTDNIESSIIEWEHDNTQKKIFSYSTGIGKPVTHYIDLDSEDAQLHQAISKQFPGEFVSLLSTTQDRRHVLFKVRNDKDPGTYYLFDKNTKKADILFIAADHLEPDNMATREPIQFEARDGLKLHGYLTMHPVSDGKKRPLILLPHGGPNYSNDWFFDHNAQFLANRGYAVLQVNFRGSGGRGIAFEQSGYKHWGDKMQYDLIDGVKWAIKQPGIDGDKVCSFGKGYGAYASMMVTMIEPDMFKCAIGYAGFYDLPLAYTGNTGEDNEKMRRILLKHVGNDLEELKKISPSYQANKISVPVFIAHGDADAIAPATQANSMRNALNSANKPYEWMLAKNEGHGFYATKNLKEFYERLEQFLAKHLGQ